MTPASLKRQKYMATGSQTHGSSFKTSEVMKLVWTNKVKPAMKKAMHASRALYALKIIHSLPTHAILHDLLDHKPHRLPDLPALNLLLHIRLLRLRIPITHPTCTSSITFLPFKVNPALTDPLPLIHRRERKIALTTQLKPIIELPPRQSADRCSACVLPALSREVRICRWDGREKPGCNLAK